jgi:hypothetical protein
MSAILDMSERLTQAATQGDKIGAWDAAGRLIGWLSDLRNVFSPEELRKLVWDGAAKHRWFDIAEVLAGAAAARVDATPSVRRLHAQMLMERGYAEEALARLHALLEQGRVSGYERGQALGHIGRIYKGRFVDAVARNDASAIRTCLEQAIRAYLTGYQEDQKSVWHGINAMALLARPEALAVQPEATARARAIAAEVRNEVQRQKPNLYTAPTMAEAYVALGEYGPALEWIRHYVSDPRANAFSLGNFRRQLTEIWNLDRRSSPGPEVVALVSAVLLEKENGVLLLSGDEVARAKQSTSAQCEAVFGADRFDSLENYRLGLERCACVARIGRTVDTGVGTGFVVPGKALGMPLGDAFVLVTNAHVISENEYERSKGALHPTEAVITFAAMHGVPPDMEFGVTKILLSSPLEELDVTIAQLSESVEPNTAFSLAPVLPTRHSGALVRVIGHPSGRGLSLSANKLLDHEPPKLHYRTATEGGSSGSPVFTQNWKLIALHHAGGSAMPKLHGESGTYEANEGILMQEICSLLKGLS